MMEAVVTNGKLIRFCVSLDFLGMVCGLVWGGCGMDDDEVTVRWCEIEVSVKSDADFFDEFWHWKNENDKISREKWFKI
jgi:hypothetical protein